NLLRIVATAGRLMHFLFDNGLQRLVQLRNLGDSPLAHERRVHVQVLPPARMSVPRVGAGLKRGAIEGLDGAGIRKDSLGSIASSPCRRAKPHLWPCEPVFRFA